MKNKIYYWSSDTSLNSGEGILANKFLAKLKKKNPNIRLIPINNEKRSKGNLIGNYIMPFLGVIKIWKYSLKNNHTCYVIYLPLWNFLLFLFLPRKTILGPITGTIIDRKFNKIINLMNVLSTKIITIKYNKILLASNFFIKNFKKKKNLFSNFILSDFNKSYIVKNKEFDFVIYYRKYSTKGNLFIYNIVKLLIKKNYYIAIIGDKFPSYKNIKNFGYIKKNEVYEIVSKSKYSISSAENLYSFFNQDCLSKNLIIFYNKIFENYCEFFKNQLIPIDYSNYKISYKIILHYIKNVKLKKNKTKIKFNFNYDDYFIF